MSAQVDNQGWSLTDRVDVLLAQAEYERELDPELGESAAMMVLVGDVYVLREETVVIEDGWGKRRYTADLNEDPI